MRARAPDERELKELSDLTSLVEKRSTDLTHADIRALIVLPENETKWHLHFALLDFVSESEVSGDKAKLEYDSLRLVRSRLLAKDALKKVERLVKEGAISIEGLGEDDIDGHLWSENWGMGRVISSRAGFGAGLWPSAHYRYEANDQKYNTPRGPFLQQDLPSVIDFSDATSYWLGVDRNDNRLSSGRPTVWIRIADYRGRIDELQVSSGTAHIKVASKSGPTDSLLAKLVIERPEGAVRQDADVSKGEVDILLPSPWKGFHVYLLHKPTGELVDYKTLYMDFPERADSSVHIEYGSGDVGTWLQSGENEWTEFKAGIQDDDLLETVVSFANGKGGRILLGVGDNGRVVGFSEEKGIQRIESIVHGRVDPVPQLECKSITYNGRPIVIIAVPPGEDPPYTLRDRGVFIRSGSTDRVPTRAELDRLFSHRKDLSDSFYLGR